MKPKYTHENEYGLVFEAPSAYHAIAFAAYMQDVLKYDVDANLHPDQLHSKSFLKGKWLIGVDERDEGGRVVTWATTIGHARKIKNIHQLRFALYNE
jgi:hypothetical protein